MHICTVRGGKQERETDIDTGYRQTQTKPSEQQLRQLGGGGVRWMMGAIAGDRNNKGKAEEVKEVDRYIFSPQANA